MGQAFKITSIDHLTHDVIQIRTEKPEHIKFTPGQAADISINKIGWENELRAFTFTSLPSDGFLEFVIKIYPEHKAVTNELKSLTVGDELIIGEIFGDIEYKGEGLFIAGGAGITPFIAIFKQLEKENRIGNNTLLFANKTKEDIILEHKLKSWLGNNVSHVLSQELNDAYLHGYITKKILSKNLGNLKYIYVCGPPPMMDAVTKICSELKISSDRIIKEAF